VHYCEKQINVDELAGSKLNESHFDTLLGGEEDCDIFKPDGSPLIKYRAGWFTNELCKAVIPACRKAAVKTNNRGMAAGDLQEVHLGTNRPIDKLSKTHFRTIKRDGRTSNTKQGGEVASGIVGYFERTARFPFCRQTSFLISQAAAWKRFLPYIERADEGFKTFMPERWRAQYDYAQQTAVDWVIPQSTFTTVTVNRNFQTATHKDAGDLSQGFGVMSCLRNDKYQGAYLVFPAYRVAIDYAHGCLCLADVHEWHSNTDFKHMRIGYERITLVFYYREKMIHCKKADEEVVWAKNRKRGERMT